MSERDDEPRKVRTVAVSVQTPDRRIRVLVVEDDPTQLKLYERALTTSGFEVDTLTSGLGVVNRVAGMSGPAPDVVVLDNMLPALNGSSLLALLAKHPDAGRVPVLLHSASDPGDVDVSTHPLARFQPKEGIKSLIAAVKAVTEEKKP